MNDWVVTQRAVVFPWQCDHYGHMNVRFYVDNFDDSAFQIWPALERPSSMLRELGVDTITARNSISFVNEASPGTMIVITGALTRVGNKSVTHTHRMESAETGEVFATMDSVEVCFDLETRQSTAMPDELRAFLESKLVDTEPATGLAPRKDTAGAATGHTHVTHRSLVFPWRCDHFGHMNARWYAHHFDDGGFHLFSMAGVPVAALHGRDVALVTAQIEINYVHEMLPGELFLIRSGFVHVGNKSARHLHRMYNAETGVLTATMEAVDVAFDMNTRRSVEIPEDVKTPLQENLVDPGDEWN